MATWLGKEKSFHMKSVIDNHNCSSFFKFGSNITLKWIKKHFMNKILRSLMMGIKKLKAKVSKKFNLIASVTTRKTQFC